LRRCGGGGRSAQSGDRERNDKACEKPGTVHQIFPFAAGYIPESYDISAGSPGAENYFAGIAWHGFGVYLGQQDRVKFLSGMASAVP
jgi:hypothetical protein